MVNERERNVMRSEMTSAHLLACHTPPRWLLGTTGARCFFSASSAARPGCCVAQRCCSHSRHRRRGVQCDSMIGVVWTGELGVLAGTNGSIAVLLSSRKALLRGLWMALAWWEGVDVLHLLWYISHALPTVLWPSLSSIAIHCRSLPFAAHLLASPNMALTGRLATECHRP
ncbi:hypothetical protein T440DRAFT_222611 [Plenodomus tracheiphilus IPT5]|uniref:Uncharacterized protein n=1 Tax=Plenodomus tracheiphilus IPT5 TaxID=1408161 RepID=A0A6A7ATV8_9PLEO|nr:hypothetical protein T440DRAFT_222611 [Plenodomus tracheiphilus IPT5]